MPAYTFEALDDQGNTRKGVIEGESARVVRGQLRAQSLVPLNVEPVTGESANGWGGLHPRDAAAVVVAGVAGRAGGFGESGSPKCGRWKREC